MVRRFLTGFLFIILITLLAWPLLPRRYEATTSLIVRATDENGQIDVARSLLQPLDENAIQSEIDTISSNALASELIKGLNLSEDPEFRTGPSSLATRIRSILGTYIPALRIEANQPTEADILRNVQDRLTVSRERRSYTIRISYWSTDSAKAAKMANMLATSYLEFLLRQKTTAFESVNDRLKRQILELADRESNTILELESTMEKTGLNDPTLPISLERQIEILSAELGQIRARKAQASALVAIPSSNLIVASMGLALPRSEFNTPTSNAGTDQLQRRTEINEMGADRIAQTDLSRIELEERLIRNEIANLQAERRKLSVSMPQVDTLKRTLTVIRTQLDNAREQLLTRLAKANQSRPDAQILVEARPASFPAFPNPLFVSLVTIFAATVSGLALALPKLPLPKGDRAVQEARHTDKAGDDLSDIRFFRR